MLSDRSGQPMSAVDEAQWALEHHDVIRSNDAWRDLVRRLVETIAQSSSQRLDDHLDIFVNKGE